MNIDLKDIKIKIKLLSSDKVLAQATVILFDYWEEHAWKILKSNQPHRIFGEYVWIQSPSYRVGSSWKEIVFINNEQLFRGVEGLIYNSYCKEKERQEAIEYSSLTEEDEKKIEEIEL